MSRSKLGRSVVDACADCGALDPTWASINKGILICDECCSIHRTLGRNVSYVKSLRKGTWVPTQLAMVHALHSNGANAIWEHSLLDPTNSKSGRRKPQPKDPIKPTKADFIRTKHQLLGFVYRPGGSKNEEKDLQDSQEGDASRQLHSSVRTANLETSLRLLSCGADPNFFHPEKGTFPLHVAAGAGQASQVELLLVYGADPGSLDSFGKTPADHARESSYTDIAYRLVECQYELTDRISYYLCERKPDHSSGQHFLIPEMADSIDSNSEVAKTAKRRLQMLPNYLFEEMAMDVYDEIDRRETENFWLSLQGPSVQTADRGSVPFLPVNAELSATRNQARQKLGRLNAREFTTLLIDLLSEAKRRQMGCLPALAESRHLQSLRESQLKENSDDEPLYDSVASEDDFNVFGPVETVEPPKAAMAGLRVHSDYSEPLSTVSVEAYMDIKEQLSLSNSRMQQLLKSNNTMQDQIGVLQNMVQTLVQENNNLKTATGPPSSLNGPVSTPSAVTSPNRNAKDVGVSSSTSEHSSLITMRNKNAATRPYSMYEPREGPRSQRTQPTSVAGNTSSTYNGPGLPSRSTVLSEDVIRHTNVVTKRIQEVFRTVQDRRQDQLEPCAERIQEAVRAMADMFAQGQHSEEVKSCIQQLTESSARLKAECHAVYVDSSNGILDHATVTQRIIQGAYEVAKATKQIVTLFQ